MTGGYANFEINKIRILKLVQELTPQIYKDVARNQRRNIKVKIKNSQKEQNFVNTNLETTKIEI